MIKARHHKIIYPFFQLYGNWKIKRNFHRVFIMGTYHEKNLPILIISNHLSWWDGFWISYLNMKFFRRKFNFMMLEEQLKKHSYFTYTGGFSIKKGSKSILETLRYAAELLSDEKSLLLIFPQGEIQSMHTRTFKFEKGIETILKNTSHDLQILFVANLVEYFSHPKPSLYMYFTEYSRTEPGIEKIQLAYNLFYEQCIVENQKLRTE